ncbi:MAG: squalene/phytoene synthase family protein [Acidithiobacillus sp.]
MGRGGMSNGAITPWQDYARSIAPAGSTQRRALSYLRRDKRPAALVLLALLPLWQEAAQADPRAAALQRQWWQEELQRLAAGAARHPLTRAIAALPAATIITPEKLAEILDAAFAMSADPAGLSDWERQQTAAVLQQELLARLYDTHPIPAAYPRQLALGLSLAGILLNLGAHVRRGRISLPRERLAYWRVTPASLLALQPSGDFPALMDELHDAVRGYLVPLPELIAPRQHAQRPGLILARLQLAHLDLAQNTRWPVLHQRSVLPPLRLWWQARRYDRQLSLQQVRAP